MNKQKIGLLVAAACFSMTALAAPLTQAEQDTIANNCKTYLTQYDPLSGMPADTAKAAAPALEACYKNYSCQNTALSTVKNCQNNLDTWYTLYTLPKPGAQTTAPVVDEKIPSTTPAAPVVQPTAPVIQTQPTEQPAAAPATPAQPVQAPKEEKKSGINWF